jgi:TonB family protein
MRRATADRIDHAIAAAAVLVAHAVMIWTVAQMRADSTDENTLAAAEPVVASLIQRPRNLSLGPVPVQVTTEDVLRLQRFAPKVPDIPVAEPEPAIEAVPSHPVSSSEAPVANAGLAGDASTSSGRSGGGLALALVQRVVPKYPARSAEKHEEGATRMNIRVAESGQVVEAEIARSSGHQRLDGAALDAVRKWKFAPMPSGTAPDGAWVATEVRFILYRYTYSRLVEVATETVYAEEIKAGLKDEPTPGSEQALSRFIEEVRAGNLGPEADELRAALEEWGEVKSIRFTGTAGEPQWVLHDGTPKSRSAYFHPTVLVQWNRFEVLHEHATSEWLIAVDREGTVWNARASRAPWL